MNTFGSGLPLPLKPKLASSKWILSSTILNAVTSQNLPLKLKGLSIDREKRCRYPAGPKIAKSTDEQKLPVATLNAGLSLQNIQLLVKKSSRL
jgi:hypothetical protein